MSTDTATQSTHRVLTDPEKFRLWNFVNDQRSELQEMHILQALETAKEALSFEITECNMRRACKVQGVKLRQKPRVSRGLGCRSKRQRREAVLVGILRDLLYDLGKLDKLAELNRVFPVETGGQDS